jgi:hypothetical protein
MTAPSPKVPVVFTVEELKDIRDALDYHRRSLQKSAADTGGAPLKGIVLEMIEAKISDIDCFHQRIVGIICIAEQKERELR